MIDSVAKAETAREKRKAHGIGRWFSKWPVWVYRLHLGWLLGYRFLLVTHCGRRSGKIRQTGVMVLYYDPNSHTALVVAGTKSADWYRNIQAEPSLSVAVAGRRFIPAQRFVPVEELAANIAWSRRHHPVRAWIQSRFFRWPWTRSPEEILALARSLGGVAFRPAELTGDR